MRESFDNAAKWAGVAVLNGGLILVNAADDAFISGVVTSACAGYSGYKALKAYLAGVEELHHESTKHVTSAYDSTEGAAAAYPTPKPGELGPKRFY